MEPCKRVFPLTRQEPNYATGLEKINTRQLPTKRLYVFCQLARVIYSLKWKKVKLVLNEIHVKE